MQRTDRYGFGFVALPAFQSLHRSGSPPPANECPQRPDAMQTASIMANRALGGKREELLVASGNTSQRRCVLNPGDYLEWKFRELDEHGIETAVYFVRKGANKGDEVSVRAMLRRKIDAQSFTATEAGELVFMFDNTFSWWTDKRISLEIKKRSCGPAKTAPKLVLSAPDDRPTPTDSAASCPNTSAADDNDVMSPGVSEHEEAAVQELLRAEAEWASKRSVQPEPQPELAPEPE